MTDLLDASQPILLPISTIQPDFLTVVADVHDGLVPEDTFWLSCYKSGETSVHGKVRIALDERNRNLVDLEGLDGVGLQNYGGDIYFAACPLLHIPHTRIVVPTNSYSDPSTSDSRREQITAFDVAPDGSQFATAYLDGSVHIRSVSPSSPPSVAKPHLSTVTSLRFFPSSRVLLTASVDLSLSILPAELRMDSAPSAPLAPVRTLRGHTRPVTSTAIVARGRTLLSGARDGTLRLWDVPSGAQIRSLPTGSASYVPVLALSVGARPEGDGLTDADVDVREVDTGDKVAVCALQDGSFEVVDLRTKRAVFRSAAAKDTGALYALDYVPQHGLLATGAARGVVALYDVRTLSTPLTSFRRNSAPVEDVQFVTLSQGMFVRPNASSVAETEVGLAIATEDGLPYIASVHPEGPAVRAELVGSDCDAVCAVRMVRGEEVWTAADDGVVRRYRVR